jgi:chromosome segregation ATPase
MEYGTTEQLTEQILDAALSGDGAQVLRLRRERAELHEQIEAQDLANRCAELKAKIQDLEQERDESKRERLAYEAAHLLAVESWKEARAKEETALAQCRGIDAQLYLASARIRTLDEQRRAAQRELDQLINNVGGH